jgi:hypothetical protein
VLHILKRQPHQIMDLILGSKKILAAPSIGPLLVFKFLFYVCPEMFTSYFEIA